MQTKIIPAVIGLVLYSAMPACSSAPSLPPVEALTSGALRLSQSDLKELVKQGYEMPTNAWTLSTGNQAECREKVCQITLAIRKPARAGGVTPRNQIVFNQAEASDLLQVMEASKGVPGRRITHKDADGFLSCTPGDCSLSYDFSAAAVYSTTTSEKTPLQRLITAALASTPK